DLRKGVQGSVTLVATELRLIRDDAVMTDAEMEKAVTRLSGIMGLAREQAGRAPRNLRAMIDARAKDSDRVAAARKRLIDGGANKDLMNKVLPLQVILLDEKREFEVLRDDGVKLLTLAVWQIDAVARGATRSDALFSDLLPNVV